MTGAPMRAGLFSIKRTHVTLTAVVAVLPATLVVAGCAAAGHPAASASRSGSARVVPRRILRAPKSLLGLAGPQSDGTMWALAGRLDADLFRFDSGSGKLAPGVPVSNSARSVAVSPISLDTAGRSSYRCCCLDYARC